jgi:hypothetical protein
MMALLQNDMAAAASATTSVGNKLVDISQNWTLMKAEECHFGK